MKPDKKDSIFCNVCSKYYVSEKTFNAHIKTSYKHQDKNPYTCFYCNKTFSSKAGITYHNTVCKHKTEKVIEQTQLDLDTEIEQYKEIVAKKDKLISILQEQVFNLRLDLENKDGALQATKEAMKEIKPNQTMIVNNNKTFIQNIGNNLVPIREDELRETIDKLSIHHFKQGPKGVVKFVTIDYLAPRVVCTDISRYTTVWRDENKEIIHDNGSRRLSEKVSSIIGEKDYTPMLDAFDASIDQTSPEDLIDMNTAYDSVLQFKNKRQTVLNELARGISKGVKTVKQLSESKNNFLMLQQRLKKFIDRQTQIIVLNGMEGVFLTLIKHFQIENNDIELLTEIDKVKNGEYMWWSSKESSCTYILDDSNELFIDKHHEVIVNEVCKFVYSIRKCTPFVLSDIEYKICNENSSELCELYQECL